MGKQLIKRALGFIYENKFRSGIYLLSSKEKSRDSQISFLQYDLGSQHHLSAKIFSEKRTTFIVSRKTRSCMYWILWLKKYLQRSWQVPILLKRKKDYSISCRLKSKNGMYVVVYKAFDLKNLLLRDDTLPRRPKIVPIIGEWVPNSTFLVKLFSLLFSLQKKLHDVNFYNVQTSDFTS